MIEASGAVALWRKRPWVIAWLLAAATFALFSPAIGYDFINFDDNLYVYENPHVLHGLSWAGLAYAFQSIDGASWSFRHLFKLLRIYTNACYCTSLFFYSQKKDFYMVKRFLDSFFCGWLYQY